MPQPTITTNGGVRTFAAFSGTPTDTVIFSGAGRVNQILPHSVQASGLAVTFYDAAVVSSGGPFAASGHTPVGVIPATLSPASGSAFTFNGTPIPVDMPFRSGLCVALKSGQTGFTVSYTPEVNTY